jgi:3-deoxy-D-manno-octulosonic-acid transferase
MEIIFYQIFCAVLLIFRTLLAIPFIILKNLIPALNQRILFERRNFFNDASRSFRLDNLKADYFFHVSSEGELEQVRPLIQYHLSNFKKIELCFTSPSVEKKCILLYEQNPNLLRIYRLPLASFAPINFLYFQSLFEFITAPVVILCRYDFFPELMILSLFKKQMILLSATTKKWSYYKQINFLMFDKIVAANDSEFEHIQKFYQKKIYAFDFRVLRIFERLNSFPELIAKNEIVAKVHHYVTQLPKMKIILGSAWESDLSIFDNSELINLIKSNQCHIFIAPHKLDPVFINNLITLLEVKLGNGTVAVIDHDKEIQSGDRPVTICTVPGILCELFSLFEVAYVGGGYEKSIHSVLEPFLMGAKVICGPKINRSTEFDYVFEIAPNEIKVLKNPNSFYNEWVYLMNLNQSEDRKAMNDASVKKMNLILDYLDQND